MNITDYAMIKNLVGGSSGSGGNYKLEPVKVADLTLTHDESGTWRIPYGFDLSQPLKPNTKYVISGADVSTSGQIPLYIAEFITPKEVNNSGTTNNGVILSSQLIPWFKNSRGIFYIVLTGVQGEFGIINRIYCEGYLAQDFNNIPAFTDISSQLVALIQAWELSEVKVVPVTDSGNDSGGGATTNALIPLTNSSGQSTTPDGAGSITATEQRVIDSMASSFLFTTPYASYDETYGQAVGRIFTDSNIVLTDADANTIIGLVDAVNAKAEEWGITTMEEFYSPDFEGAKEEVNAIWNDVNNLRLDFTFPALVPESQ